MCAFGSAQHRCCYYWQQWLWEQKTHSCYKEDNKTFRYQVYLIDEKSTSVICSSCDFRKIKKGKFIKCHRCKEVIHRDTNAAINIL